MERGLVDYDMLEKTANLLQLKLLIVDISVYPRDFDYSRMRKIANGVGVFSCWDIRFWVFNKLQVRGPPLALLDNNYFSWQELYRYMSSHRCASQTIPKSFLCRFLT